MKAYRPGFSPGFSLVEVLITLAIMGLLMVFTIPPLFQTPASNSSSKYTAIVRDIAFVVINAYERYKLVNGTVATSTTMGAFTSYMNYVGTDSSTTIDNVNTLTTLACGSYTCLKLHSGAKLLYDGTMSFSGTNTTNALRFYVDPDGRQTDATTNGPGKSIADRFFIICRRSARPRSSLSVRVKKT